MTKANDEVRAAEAKRLQRDGYEPLLEHSRWCLLKREENLAEKRAMKSLVNPCFAQDAINSASHSNDP